MISSKFKILILTAIFVFAFGTMAMASDIAFYVGAVPGAYDAETMKKDVEYIIENTRALFKDVQKFADDDLDGLGKWADDNMGDGELDIIWINGSTPSVLYPLLNEKPDGSRAEKWLDDGNMIINVADYFSWGNFETGEKVRNKDAAAANILDLTEDIIVGGDDAVMKVTDTGKEFMPSLGAEVGTNRPVNIEAIAEPWEAAAIFASTKGVDDQGAGGLADPIVLHNKETDGYLAIVNQGWKDNAIDKGAACTELIKNWLVGKGLITGVKTSVEPVAKLSTIWGEIKATR